MDDTLSQFIEKTGTEPSLARDLLESTKWDVEEALRAFETLSLGPAARHNENISGDNNRVTSGKGKRGLSMVNADIVLEARSKVIEDKVPGTDERYERFEEMTDFTFVLPDLSNFSEDLSDFLRRDLIETSALVALEQAGKLIFRIYITFVLHVLCGTKYNVTDRPIYIAQNIRRRLDARKLVSVFIPPKGLIILYSLCLNTVQIVLLTEFSWRIFKIYLRTKCIAFVQLAFGEYIIYIVQLCDMGFRKTMTRFIFQNRLTGNLLLLWTTQVSRTEKVIS